MPILQWLTREEDIRAAEKVPYRLLEEVPELGYGDQEAGNMLIQGDNLDALKALLPYYAGQVKCIYIDPPFNTGQAFEHYDDNLEHSIWLGMMVPRMQLIHELLAPGGTVAVHLDDEELAYFIVIMDEIFGRSNRVNLATFVQGAAVGHKSINPGLVTVTNYVLMYAKDKSEAWAPYRVFTGRERDKRYSSFIQNYDEPYQVWKLIPLTRAFATSADMKVTEHKKSLGDEYENALNDFVIENSHRVVQPVSPDYNAVGQETRDMIDLSLQEPGRLFLQERENHPDIYLQNGKRWLFYRSKLKEIDGQLVAGEPLTNLWDDLRSNNLHNEGQVKFPKSKKPEALVKRVFELFSKPGDIVLDSFLGSGTTAAVAHKMNRRWIGIERGDHAVTHCAPRLQKVIEGENGGISKAVKWQGGGGFRFYRLGPPVFTEDGQIQPDIRFPVFAAHIWFAETGSPWTEPQPLTPFLGAHEGKGYALLYNGILGDKSASGGNVLTRKTLAVIRAAQGDFTGPLTVYGERTALTEPTLKAEQIEFKQTPYDVKARK
ncbi:site-specific DNA-methyltransferase [Marinospirillum perlucidum]|uniref:site-specific DNA-methyltransferase n=1 Tax=Marinospirillum perlucidum TaxID=1982602 RepID=UPI000DF13F2E|nr:site-specific DNA-methyltransferase [Marinospirillum perlucidum]